jgi:GNAT superfamily N-acetyltransferase
LNEIVIRDMTEEDQPRWLELWKGYCDFYETTMPDDVTAETWRRILDPGTPAFGAIVAEMDGQVVGFANYVLHPYTWAIGDQCLLHDLYVDPNVRGGGIGEKLIRFLQHRGAEQGWTRVYWMTHETNERARRLYDRFAPASGFIRYTVPVQETE